MKFPWHKYEEIPLERRNTLQIFITNKCNLKCDGCFARNVMGFRNLDISNDEYCDTIREFSKRDGRQVNLIGGEPLLHPEIKGFIELNRAFKLKTTIYTNGYFINEFVEKDFLGAKLRISLYCKNGGTKSLDNLPKTNIPFDICYMVSSKTTVDEMIEAAEDLEKNYPCETFFISSLRELDNPHQEFFYDTDICMPVVRYKEIVHKFLNRYSGNMRIDVSKRGVFESTKTLPDTHCRFANYFIGGKIIQCPFDIVNLKFQEDYSFNKRSCQHNNTCLMSKVVYQPKKN